jgi:hypothetical protein
MKLALLGCFTSNQLFKVDLFRLTLYDFGMTSRKKEARNSEYIAVIGDMLRSRDFAGAQRSRMQKDFNLLIGNLNLHYGAYLRSQFAITLGDEFQGLLQDPSIVPDIMWEVQRSSVLPRFRLGIGFGTIDTEIPHKAINLDGPAFHQARAAIQHAKKERILGAVFEGFGEQIDTIANGIARLLEFHITRRSERQLQVIDLLRKSLSQVEAADHIGRTPQAVSKHRKAAGWEALCAGEEALRAALNLVKPEADK